MKMTMTVTTEQEHEVINFMAVFSSFMNTFNKSKSKLKVKKGLASMLKGMVMVCEGVDELLNDQINELMDTRKSKFTDEELIEVCEILNTFDSAFMTLIAQIDAEELLDVKQKLCGMIERFKILVSIEQQLRPNLTVPERLDIEELKRNFSNNMKGYSGAWIEM